MTTPTTDNTKSKTITLDEPIKRGEIIIDKITLRKPSSGELRGVSLIDLGNMNVVALQQVLPRITAPILTAQDVASLDPADLMDIGMEVAGFLVKKADRMVFQKE
ncbi:phage tail assembly protein [Undibacterium umbellatum]|uniref:Phage tail assembly protein n=1 Tax=Undibacterium umbellatum TaxID=2762300 RepID=A0ABR6ZI41_9BURK|nr:phage tail assembly protein [Undibacterium umbellatum]MBC3911390.1 phage tail assembly protein [Undibacterium umbellatum]